MDYLRSAFREIAPYTREELDRQWARLQVRMDSLPQDPQPTERGTYFLGEDDQYFYDTEPMSGGHLLVLLGKDDRRKFGWWYPEMPSLMLAYTVWDPAIQDEPLGWDRRIVMPAGVRRAPKRDPTATYNGRRCPHGVFVDAWQCKDPDCRG